ncbi:MAG: Spy/CpxP family protein refolding chaperone [Balneolales bacterium]
MKTVLILFFALILNTNSQVLAQSQRAGGGMTCIQQIITQYGEELKLTEDQKLALVEVSLDNRTNRQAMQAGRRNAGMRGQRQMNSNRNPRRSERVRNAQVQGQRPNADLFGCQYQSMYEILDNEQTSKLQNLLIDRVEQEQELLSLSQMSMLNRAEIEGEKLNQVKAILDRQNQAIKSFKIERINNPAEINRTKMQELQRIRLDGNEELKSILTASEYESLQQLMRPGNQRQYSRAGGPGPR